MALPYTFTNTGHPTIDATQVNANFAYLDTGKPRNGVISAIAADSDSTATPTAVTYSPAFSNATDQFTTLVFLNYTGTDFPVFTYKITNVTATGFSIIIGGGQPGSKLDVHWGVIGH